MKNLLTLFAVSAVDANATVCLDAPQPAFGLVAREPVSLPFLPVGTLEATGSGSSVLLKVVDAELPLWAESP